MEWEGGGICYYSINQPHCVISPTGAPRPTGTAMSLGPREGQGQPHMWGKSFQRAGAIVDKAPHLDLTSRNTQANRTHSMPPLSARVVQANSSGMRQCLK